MTPLKAIRARCLDCSGGSFAEVRECSFDDCPLYEYRLGHRPTEKVRTPMKAIRAHCVACCNSNIKEPVMCTAIKCPLHAYKLGKRPKGYNSPQEVFKTETMPLAPNILANKGITGGITP